ncbi:MAG: hypothetical protein IIA17_01840 [candidate division Zixibacteria bacterium]|nr:hypothetical protein [candidate division Zixibacteria bacterium]
MEELDLVVSEFEEYGEFAAAGEEISEPVEMAYLVGYLDATQGEGEVPILERGSKGGCGCSDKKV